ncbi:hypothetical protein RCG23_18230 [Neobacillus sp. PS3-34]|uniref:hypothetical protein n=1 Tax=Neobacillus sp. PS3-34 TaxID=3070678 RepID=UPI0027E0A076|nr:hypothetical protein [Neobacillus sp. PS3-34]WML47380.1 hypothetical protein RCG23_18230 [Neobacillus sp. PS3-34]
MKSVFFAALFAVLLGTSFGIVMLKLVITDKAGPAPGNVVETITKPVQQDPTEKASSSTIGPLTTYIIQEGVYSTKQSALGVAASAEEKGVSAQVTEINGKAYLFLGAADSLDNAKKLGSTYQTLGFTVYAKPFSVAEKELKKISGEEKSFFEKAISLFNGLSASSTAAITDHSLSKDTAIKSYGNSKGNQDIEGIGFKE